MTNPIFNGVVSAFSGGMVTSWTAFLCVLCYFYCLIYLNEVNMSTIELKKLTFGFDNQTQLLFDQTNLIIDTNWKLALIGRNGRGKTT